MNAVLLMAQLVGATEVVEDECDNTARIKLLSVITVRSFPLSFLLSPLRLWYSLGARLLRHWRGTSSKNLRCSSAFKASYAELPARLSLPRAQLFFSIETLLWFSPGAMPFLALWLYSCCAPLLEYLWGRFTGSLGFPSGKESAWQCRRPRFDPWVGKIPWRREW